MIASIYYVDEAHYDIKDSAYQLFLKKCFHYSTFFSVISPRNDGIKRSVNNEQLFESLEPYLYFKKQTNEWPGTILMSNTHTGYSAPVTFFVYRCTDETKEIIASVCNSIFSWYKGLPEDLSFYYPDKKIFLYTVAHEGSCVLSCSPNIYNEFSIFNTWTIDSPTDYLNEIYF